MGFLRETIRAYQKNDPAARSALEIFFLYNGLHATIYYRISHWLYCHHCRFLARWVSVDTATYRASAVGRSRRRPMAVKTR